MINRQPQAIFRIAAASACVLDATVRAADAEELRYYILKPLTDRFAAQNGISVTQAEKDAYIADVKAFMARDRAARKEPEPAPDTPEEAAARQEMAAAFILHWKVNQALHRQ